VTAIPSRKTKREYRKEKLNIEEKEIEALYGSNALELHKPDKELLRQLKAAAENTFKKDRRINIRLSEHDLVSIQSVAAT
jgi:predicted DNA binding CopG/RHH family protein